MNHGNRPDDVCALCDRPIDLRQPGGWASLHRYLGTGWVHGGGREYIAVHLGCAWLENVPEGNQHDIHRQIATALWGTAA